jgi:hypothetical protein
VPRKGEKPNAAQLAALKRGQAARAEQLADPEAEPGRVRWMRLLDGTLPVTELTDKELKNMKVKGRGGNSAGGAIPSHIARAMRNEWMKRGSRKLESHFHEAVDILIDLMRDDAVKPETKRQIGQMIIERNIGKVPDKVVVATDDDFSTLLGDALEVEDDRALTVEDVVGPTSP